MSLSWTGNEAVVSYQWPDPVQSKHTVALIHFLVAIRDAMPILTALYRYDANHPALLGLEGKPLQRGVLTSRGKIDFDTYIPAERILEIASWIYDQPLEVFDEIKDVGWFSPEADPSKLGTPYLVFRSGKEAFTDSEFTRDLFWELAYVGIGQADSNTVSAKWNDLEAIEGLVRAVMTRTHEDVCIERSLVSSERFSRDRLEHERRSHIMQAREIFARKQIKPQVSTEAIHQVLMASNPERSEDFRSRRRLSSGLIPLNNREIFGEKTKPVYAAYWVRYNEKMTTERLHQIIHNLDAKTHELGNKIGSLFLVPEQRAIILTRLPEQVEQFPRAFRLEPGQRLIPATIWLAEHQI